MVKENKERIKICIECYEIETREVEHLNKDDTFIAKEDLCYILLPSEFIGKTIVCITTDLHNL